MQEEIIIDGVNVAGCIYYNAEKLANCGMFAQGDFKCEGQICLYKQLKRLEQKHNTICYNLGLLEQENKELKEKNKYQKKEIRMYDCIDKWDTKECHCACRCLGNEFCDDAAEKINTYRSALEEIKRYAGERCRQKVLDKINEVLNDK